MAFCPECGKPATAEASKCVHCGHELAPGHKSPARFKGTMMMSAPVVGAGEAAQTQKKSTAPSAPAPQGGPAPAPIAPPPAAGTASVVPKPGLKATMVGAGITPPSPAGAVATASPSKPAPAASDADDANARKLAFAATQPQSAVTLPQPAGSSSAEAPAASAPVSIPEGSADQKFLPGDPMAPTAPTATAARPASRMSRFVPTPPEKNQTWLLITIAVIGMVLIAAVGAGTAIYMGLWHLPR